jgi:hypothetical protein
MHKLYESIIEIVGWIKIALSPTLIGAGLGWIVYYNIPTTTGIIIAALLLLSGIVVGSVWATRVWNRQGTNSFLASIMATPDIDEAIRKNELTILEAYKAAYVFLQIQNQREPSEEIAIILGGMQLIMCKDGHKRPMIQSNWEDWEDAIRTSGTRVHLYNQNVEDYGILITKTEGYQVLHAFLYAYNNRGPTAEIEFLLKHMLPETSEYYNTFNDDWNDAIAYVHTHEHCADIQWK